MVGVKTTDDLVNSIAALQGQGEPLQLTVRYGSAEALHPLRILEVVKNSSGDSIILVVE